MGRILGATLILLSVITGVAYAHHSTANFDRTRLQTITGTVKYFGFTNPHSYIDMSAPNPVTGKTEDFKVFAAGRVLLVRYDWKVSDLKAGDIVKVSGYPDRKDPHFMYLAKVTFASGKVWERSNIPD
ncbi:MAG: DUF6152 family protein [Pseudomonadota bacterium]